MFLMSPYYSELAKINPLFYFLIEVVKKFTCKVFSGGFLLL